MFLNHPINQSNYEFHIFIILSDPYVRVKASVYYLITLLYIQNNKQNKKVEIDKKSLV